MRILPGIKVSATDIVFATHPDDYSTESQGESSFKVNIWLLEGKIGDKKLRATNFGQNLIAYFLVVMNLIDSYAGQFAILLDSNLDSKIVGRLK
jgi:hypothetical protein